MCEKYVKSLKTIESYHLTGVTDRQVTCGHFRARDKDGDHTIGSAVVDNPMYANLVALSFIEPDLWEIGRF